MASKAAVSADSMPTINDGTLQSSLTSAGLIGVTLLVLESVLSMTESKSAALQPWDDAAGDDDDEGMSDGVLAGIIVGSIVGCAIFAGMAFFAVKKGGGPSGKTSPDY